MTSKKFNLKHFIIVTLITSIWIQISEVFRYFVFVMPRVKLFFNNQPNIATMNWPIFSIWGLWGTLLTAILVFIFWLYSNVFGSSHRSVIISSTLVWLAIFVIFWVATANMGLSEWNILWITLSLSWLEIFVGTYIAFKLYKKYEYEII